MTTSATTTTANDLEATLKKLAPLDLADKSLYIVQQSESPPADLLLLDSFGNFHPRNDLVFRSWLESCGRWRGRGPLVVVNDALIRDASSDQDAEANILGIGLHEFAHALNVGFDLSEITAAEIAMIQHSASLAIIKLNAASPSTQPPTGLPWVGHDAHFIRVAGHLVHRARRDGLDVMLADVINLEQCELRGNAHEYFSALEGEFEQFTGLPLTTLRQYRPPRDFERVWRRDLSDWCSQETDDVKAMLAFHDMDHLFSGAENG